MLSIEGALVTIDAIGCQRDIAQQIIDKKADYILALKGIKERCATTSNCSPTSRRQALFGHDSERRRNRRWRSWPHETRRVTVLHDVAWLQQRHDWPGLKGVVVIDSTREIGARTERETRYYLTSSAWRAERLGPMVRDHWAVENSLHWVMDMTFRDDECRIRTEHAPENFVTLKHMAANLARKAPKCDSVRSA